MFNPLNLMILFKTLRQGLSLPSISFTGIFQELSSLPTEKPFQRIPLMSLPTFTEFITYWYKTSLQTNLPITEAATGGVL